jgi:hypothetical protein
VDHGRQSRKKPHQHDDTEKLLESGVKPSYVFIRGSFGSEIVDRGPWTTIPQKASRDDTEKLLESGVKPSYVFIRGSFGSWTVDTVDDNPAKSKKPHDDTITISPDQQ